MWGVLWGRATIATRHASPANAPSSARAEQVPPAARDEHDDDGVLGQVIKTAVLSTIRTALNHSADIDKQEVMTNFSESDARRFVREVRKRIDRER